MALCSSEVYVKLREGCAPSLVVSHLWTVPHNTRFFICCEMQLGGTFDPLKQQSKDQERLFIIFLLEDFRRVCAFHTLEKVFIWVTECAEQVANLRQQFHRHLNQDPGSSLSKIFPKGQLRGNYMQEKLSLRVDWLTGFYAPYIRVWKLHLGLYTIYALLEMLFCDQNSIKSASVDFWRRRGTNEHVWCSSYSFTSE